MIRRVARLFSMPVWFALLAATAMPALLALDTVIEGGMVEMKESWDGGDLRRFAETVQQFGDPVTIIITAALIIRLDPARRRRVWDMILASITTGLVCLASKMAIGRPRPGHTGDWLLFDGWEMTKRVHSRFQSMPSSHTAAAMALAVFLFAVYPRIRGMVVAIVTLVALSRFFLGVHYPSDIVAGAVIGLLIAVPIVKHQWGSRSAIWVGSRFSLPSDISVT